MPSAENVADAASRWADAGLLSAGSVFTSGLQAIGRDGERAGEVAKGSIRWEKRDHTQNPSPSTDREIQLFAGNAYSSGAVLVNKSDVGACLEAPGELCLISVANEC